MAATCTSLGSASFCRASVVRSRRTFRVVLASATDRPVRVLRGAKHVHPEAATLGCPDSESGFCEMTVNARSMGSPDSETGMASRSFDSDALSASRPHAHIVGHHLIHQAYAGPSLGCPDSESGVCEFVAPSADSSIETEAEHDDNLGAWEF